MKIQIYSDVVCPWCYVGEQRFSRALAAFPRSDQVEVVFKPYQLDPAASTRPRPVRENLARKYGAAAETMIRQVTDVAAGEGLELRFDRARSVNTLAAHRLVGLAGREYGSEVQRAVVERLFRAHFTDGASVADPELLADVAADAGMDRARVVQYLAGDEGLGAVQAEIAEAQRLGIRAVPTFVFDGRQALQGAQATSTFLQVLEELHAQEAAPAGGEEGALMESCEDGRCAT